MKWSKVSKIACPGNDFVFDMLYLWCEWKFLVKIHIWLYMYHILTFVYISGLARGHAFKCMGIHLDATFRFSRLLLECVNIFLPLFCNCLNISYISFGKKNDIDGAIFTRAVASLTVPGGQEFHFPHFFPKFWSFFLIFPQTFLIFFLILALRVGDSPTREGPGYATDFILISIN